MTRCPECGAPALPYTCEELFHAVLALDHSRLAPWGPLHGVTVACFLLQHPSRLPAGPDRTRTWAILHAYLDEGLPAVARLTARARRANSHRNRTGVLPGAAAMPPAPEAPAYGVTIADVARDGTFPADGFPERVTAWARATADAWAPR
ncbi:DUF5946 family protein [Sinosporangium siamense]|uniref:Uncharacterized protein n=1 Tax=Sinosporangium siamense TaxID=1367973 RepID=A0A919V8G6_9ACTN|nr:DUF5946 family protein [Sinosporangium siamense]GII96120.1 hypothetical protein Ssi02_63510 [Sinosporangium siamense]